MRFCAEKCTAKMLHSAPAETLHDILRLHDTQAVLALCVVVRAQFCREPCEKIMNIYIADCTIMSYLLGMCRLTPALLIFMKFSKHSGENSDVKNQQIFRGWRGRTRGNLSQGRKISKHFFKIGKMWQNGACRVRTISLTVS